MSSLPDTPYRSTIELLGRPADLRSLPLPAIHSVMTMRFCALADQLRGDILPALATRFGSVTVAQEALGLTDTVRRCWPESFLTSRPCCMGMTPDERTLGRLARLAMRADRHGFDEELEGFIRPAFREGLFAASVRTVAHFMAL